MKVRPQVKKRHARHISQEIFANLHNSAIACIKHSCTNLVRDLFEFRIHDCSEGMSKKCSERHPRILVQGQDEGTAFRVSDKFEVLIK